jgi:hypothetical protein
MHPRSTDLSFKNASVPENKEHSSYGMPVYWSFLEYNEEKKRQLRGARPENPEKRIKLEEKQTQTESPPIQEPMAQAAKVAEPTRDDERPSGDLREKPINIDIHSPGVIGVQSVPKEKNEAVLQTQPISCAQDAAASIGKPEEQLPTKNPIAENPDTENVQSLPEFPSSAFLRPDSDSDDSLPDIDSGNEASDIST